MLKSTEIQLKISEVREAINGLPDDADAETLNNHTKEYHRLEAAYRAALVSEADDLALSGADFGPDDGTSAETRALLDRASLRNYLIAAGGSIPPKGVEAELRASLLGDDAPETMIPIDVLLRRSPEVRAMEQRADANTSITTSYAEFHPSIAQRVFAAGAGAYLSIDRPTVPAGDASFPYLTGGATADYRSPGVDKDAEAASLTVGTVGPVRLSARYNFSMESNFRLNGFEQALANDLTSAIEDELDKVAIQGQAAVNNVSPAIEGIIDQLTDPTNPTDTTLAADVLNLFSGAVDGKYQPSEDDVRVLLASDAYGFVQNLLVNTTGGARMIRDIFDGNRLRASANMQATASGIATALIHRGASPIRGYVQPVWRGAEIIRDPYSGAAAGMIALTIHVLSNGKLTDSNVYQRKELKIT